MSIQKVNTERIAAAASALSLANANMNNAFGDLRKVGMTMEYSWNSQAGSAALTTMYQLFSGNDMRSMSLQNYETLLRQVVVPGYTSAENENTRLADQFL